MKTKTKIIVVGLTASLLVVLTPSFKSANINPLDHNHAEVCGSKGCTFRTLFGEESSEGHGVFKDHERVVESLTGGMAYLIAAQQSNGGWGAGSHYSQNNMDPHAVSTDPATTAMVGMALLRNGNTLYSGQYSDQVNRALNFLLEAVEKADKNSLRITDLTNTQIQTKLGGNIDAVLAAQFFNNILDLKDVDAKTKQRVKAALADCVAKIEASQNNDGSLQGAGWAGVLQSSLANQALEAAEVNDVDVDKDALQRSREFQKGNYDASTGRVNADRGAGVVLYAISGSVRASAKEARKAKELIDDAILSGDLEENAPMSQEVLEKIGVSRDEAARLNTSYNVYQSAKDQAQEDAVLNGYGNNGGEEFLSFLQTGESMVIAGGNDWKDWYDNTAGRILSIQNENGSWSGHHCITSPVFCTATCLLILSIDQDIERLQKVGEG